MESSLRSGLWRHFGTALFIGLAASGAWAQDGKAPGQAFKDCADCPEMVVLPAGRFEMGADGDTRPVSLNSFAIGKFEVTQAQWRAMMGSNPSNFKNCGPDCPVEQVSWEDIQAYLRKLNARTGKRYSLPSEAQWEYACRAGARQKYCGSDDLGAVAWWGAYPFQGAAQREGNSEKSSNRVGQRQPNAWGLHDMSGNVREATQDCWRKSLKDAPRDGSAYADAACGARVGRGGSWGNGLAGSLASDRVDLQPKDRADDGGFRVALALTPVADKPVVLNRFQAGPENDRGEKTVLDSKTRRRWMAEDFGKDISWNDANQWCGKDDHVREWRLPSRAELMQLFDKALSAPCSGETCRVSPEFRLTGSLFWTKERGGARQAGYVNLATGEAGAASSRTTGRNYRALCIVHQ